MQVRTEVGRVTNLPISNQMSETLSQTVMQDRTLWVSLSPSPSPPSHSSSHSLSVPGAKKRKGHSVTFSEGLPPLLAKARGNIYVSNHKDLT